jgi:hypothetical protein
MVNWDPLSVMILFRTPNLQMIDLMSFTVDCLLMLTTRVASSHLVNSSIRHRATGTLRRPGEMAPGCPAPTQQMDIRAGSFAATALVC